MSPDPPPLPPLQDAVLRLQEFWAAQGCVLLPACDFEVPYATLQPDSFFRVLGPAPWRAATLQPVRRPLDARYGEHPYRLIKHLQLQVVLKPPPADARSLYLESLAALGLELGLHDLRFVEWTWQLVSVGARGSGWHALLDGLGVTRLTFLERLADRELDPPCIEISYGVERLSMALQAAPDAYRVGWSKEGPEYGELRRREEEELSRYVLEVADGGDLERRLEALDGDARRCLAAGLARPAYELAVRCLEPVDVLEARGDLSARERAGWLERIGQQVAAAAALELTRATGKRPKARPGKAAARKAAGRRTAVKTAGKAAARKAAGKAAAKKSVKTAAKKAAAGTVKKAAEKARKSAARKAAGRKPASRSPPRRKRGGPAKGRRRTTRRRAPEGGEDGG